VSQGWLVWSSAATLWQLLEPAGRNGMLEATGMRAVICDPGPCTVVERMLCVRAALLRPGTWRFQRARDALCRYLLGAAVLPIVLFPAIALAERADGSPPPSPVVAGSQAATQTTGSARQEELQQQKLEQEIRKLRLENDRAQGALGWLLAVGPFVTVLVGVGTLAWTLFKQSRDLVEARRTSDQQAKQWRDEFSSRQKQEAEKAEQWRQEFLRQQQAAEQERHREELRRFDEHLSSLVTNIGSDNQAVRLNATAALSFFVKEEYPDLHCDLLNVIVANLKAAPEPAVGDLLRRHLAKTLRMLFADGRELDSNIGDRLDLTRVDLYRIDLSGLDLRNKVLLDLAFAKLRHANLRDAKINEVKGGEAILDGAHFSRAHMNRARFDKATAVSDRVRFHGTRLVGATFVGAQLPNAEFQQARLQSAHFKDAILTGAQFEGADVADADFKGATLDDRAVASLSRAQRWRKAHFEEAVREQLVRLSEGAAAPAR